uniref:Uncharacterized protein n=1 Tax=Rhizophora mucronata TaxID=61149 RepID=A0A2P2NEJ4_RHIMU
MDQRQIYLDTQETKAKISVELEQPTCK